MVRAGGGDGTSKGAELGDGSICGGRVSPTSQPLPSSRSSRQVASAPVTGEPFRKLSIFFPMWNEEAYIERAGGYAKDECEYLVAHGDILDYELIVVDDASTDATAAMADAMAAADCPAKP